MDSVLIHWMNYLTQGWHRISSHLIWSQSTKSARDPSHHCEQYGCSSATKRGCEGQHDCSAQHKQPVSTILY